ncbi:centrosomal protein of 70 kDa [Chanos chanos]|uniref:Centrosomal protein of 70 kDa n=1 Tax=Chanos chanos TaxID=29144 RepID=A0A6J2V6J0_CHACN|nr:centrosomal protein of 70 kDa [Chanos chanos]
MERERKSLNAVFQSRDKTYVFLWTYSQFQQEQTEWDAVNRLLQHHGFKPVHFADPTENKNLADLVLLERSSSADIRGTLKTMLTDSERRQALIQELIQSNSQLKEEVQEHQARAVRHSQRAAELEGVLDGVKAKVQDLEDSYISKAAQQHNQFQQLQQDKRDAEKRCQALEQKLSQEKETVSQLQKKLYFAVKEEERRVARQNQAFQLIHKRSTRPQSPVDQQILDVIDVYESQLQQLRNELKAQQTNSGENGSSDSQRNRKSLDKSSVDTSSNYKALLKSYQEQLKETKSQREELRAEIQRLKQDLESRPTVKELKSYKQQLKRMDRIIQQSSLKSALGMRAEEGREAANTDVNNIEHMPAGVCRKYLKDACKELKVHDVTDLMSALKARGREADAAIRLEKILNDIISVLTSPRAPLGLLRWRPGHQSSRELSQHVEFEHIQPTLEVWAEQLGSLEDVHRALSKLMKRLLPWQPESSYNTSPDGVKVQDVMLMLETLLEETGEEDKVVLSDKATQVLRSPTKHTLQSMVSHFQKLFDAPTLRGVYPRMNEVYTRLGEMTNAMRNLRDVLEMDDRASPSEVVNQVARVVSSCGPVAGQALQSLLETSDIDSIIVKLREHEEFFPAFHALVLDLLQILDVQCLDDIVPAVKSLKSSSQ